VLYLYLTAIVALLLVIVVGLRAVLAATQENNAKLDALRLSGRTRQSKAAIRTGVVSEERELVRLGRTSKGRRVVVGGDPDSILTENLMRGVPRKKDDDE
jgi:hypothetical protein